MAEYINPYKLFVGSFVPNWLLHRREISQGGKLCYARLCQYAGEHAAAWPAQDTIATELGRSKSEIQRYLTELIKFRLIKCQRRGLGKPNVYRFLKHEWITGFLDAAYVTTPDAADMTTKENQGRESTVTESPRQSEIDSSSPPPGAAPSSISWSFRSATAAFYEAPQNRKVGALIDMAAALGLKRSSHAAGIIRDFGGGADVARAVIDAGVMARGDPWEYMRKVLQNGQAARGRNQQVNAYGGTGNRSELLAQGVTSSVSQALTEEEYYAARAKAEGREGPRVGAAPDD